MGGRPCEPAEFHILTLQTGTAVTGTTVPICVVYSTFGGYFAMGNFVLRGVVP